tara:strand:- start:671 stop:2344 length:1674 start_codon:yes stop_codon:yes gene_type:complete
MADLVYKLRRGIKLMLEHVYAPIQTFLTRVTSTGISASTLSTGRGTFRLNIYKPAIDHALNAKQVAVPFVLPPLQEYFSSTESSVMPTIRLDEISIGFDQMGKPTAVRGRGTSIGAPDMPLAGNLGFKVSIRSKTRSTTEYGRYTDEIWSTDLSAANFQAFSLRSNPISLTDLKVSIDQDKSYAIIFEASDMKNAVAAADYISFWSANISLRFSHDLVQRDTGSTIQNIPSHDGARSVAAKTFTQPASDAVITADTATGVSKAFELLDSYVRGKYRGGYNRDSTRHDTEPHENILTDAGYEIIAVPMWGNMLGATGGTSGGGGPTPSTELPYLHYSGGWTETGQFMDRRIIPIQYPLTVHHVVAARNYQVPGALGQLPTSASFTEYVGVGIGTGLLGQTYTYEQMAFYEFGPSGKSGLIDCSAGITDPSASPETSSYIWEMHSVPLMRDGSNYGKGYTVQGKPYYAGRAISNPIGTVSGYTPSTSSRRNVGTLVAGSKLSNCAGLETFIEVRWKLQDSGANGIQDATRWHDASGNKTKSLVGFGGNWVYLICKKHLV